MKKILISFLLASIMMFCISCGNENSSNSDETLMKDADVGKTDNSGYHKDADLEKVVQNVGSSLENLYLPDTPMPESRLQESFQVPQELYENFYGEMLVTATDVDMLLIIQAKEGQESQIVDILNKYWEKCAEDTSQSAANTAKLKASRIETYGRYICYVVLGGDLSGVADGGEEEIIRYCDEHNQLALDMIEEGLR